MRKKPHISIQRCKIETIPHHYCISVKRPNPKKTHTKRPFNVLQEFKMYVPLFSTAVALQYIALIAYFHV